MSAEPIWYLLYGGESADGRGHGTYVGRTLSYDEARRHYETCRGNPYSVGYVTIIDDTSELRMQP